MAKDYEEWLEEVRKDGNALRRVPNGMKTEEMCLEAVRQEGAALCFAPEDMKTPELCMEAVRAPHDADMFESPLKYVPEALKTKELCREAVRQDNTALEWTPDGMRDEIEVEEGFRPAP